MTSLIVDALRRASSVMQAGKEIGFSMHLIDIGGGFPGNDDVKVLSKEILNSKTITSTFCP